MRAIIFNSTTTITDTTTTTNSTTGSNSNETEINGTVALEDITYVWLSSIKTISKGEDSNQ